MRSRAIILASALTALVLAVAACAARPVQRAITPPERSAQTTSSAAATASPVATTAAEATAKPDSSRFQPTLPKPKPELVYRGPNVRKVALTFDLCETAKRKRGFDPKLVDELVAAKVPATFMMGGHWAEVHARDAKRVGSVPYFEVGNHSYSHDHPKRITSAEFRDEVDHAQQAIKRLTGRTPRLWRFPFGEYDAKTLQFVTDEGFTSVQWSFESGDPDPNISADDLERVVREKARNGSILIFHANGNGVHTAEAMPSIVRWLRGHGYELVTVSELLASR